jgi:TatD DNase family protein
MNPKQFVKIDSHCHLTSDKLVDDADAIIARAKEAGVVKIININTDQKTLERGLHLQKKYPDYIENTAATTPHDVEELGESDFAVFEKAAHKGQLVAIGETGLDYYYEHSNRELQKEFLQRYLMLAKECDLPVIFHCRGDEAFTDLFKIAKKFLPFKAILHCFTGNEDQAKQCIDYGWYISMSGIVTFKKSDELREVLKTIATDRIVIETDSPYLAPQKYRGKTNESAYVHEVLEMVAKTHGCSIEPLAKEILANTKYVLGLSD